MGLRFRRSFKLAPGLRINLSKSGASLSIGGPGMTMNVGHGQVGATLGLPGTGVFYRTTRSVRRLASDASERSQQPDAGDGSLLAMLRASTVLAMQLKKPKQSPQQEAEAINSIRDALLRAHLKTPSPNARAPYEPKPFEIAAPARPITKVRPPKPDLPPFRDEKWWHAIIPWMKRSIQSKNDALLSDFRVRLAVWETSLEAAHTAEQDAAGAYEAELVMWNKKKANHDRLQERLRSLVEKADSLGEPDLDELLELRLNGIEWQRETIVSLEVNGHGSKVCVDVDLPEAEDMPTIEAQVKRRPPGVKHVKLSPTRLRKDYQTHIHGIGFRIVGEVFACLPQCDTVVLSAFSQRVDSSTGNPRDEYLYSVRVHRDGWRAINFATLEQVDVTAAFEAFELRRDSTGTGILRPIEPLAC